MSKSRKRKRAARQGRQHEQKGAAGWGPLLRNSLIAAVVVGAIGAVIAVVVLVGSGGGGGSSGTAGGSPTGDNPGVFLLHPDDTREAIKNGAALGVGDMTAEVFFSEFPPKLNSSMDVYLTDKASGAPVEGAQVTVLPSMPHPGMTKGSIQIEGAPRQPGHYSVPLQLPPMRAAWTIDIQVLRGGQSSLLELVAFLS